MRIAAVTHTIRVCILQTFLTRQRHFIDKRTCIQTGNRKVGRIAPPPDQSHLTANLFAFSANSPRVFVEQMRLRREEDKASDYNFTRQETKITASDFGKGARAAQLSLFPFLLVTKKRKARQNNESPWLGELFPLEAREIHHSRNLAQGSSRMCFNIPLLLTHYLNLCLAAASLPPPFRRMSA